MSLWDESGGNSQVHALGPRKAPELAREGMSTLAEENFTIKILEQGDAKILRCPELEAYSAQFKKSQAVAGCRAG